MAPKVSEEELASKNLSAINKQILEVKKKIQLSEGQRKALFEDCETERKANIDEISKLKKENADLVTSLYEYTSSTAKLDIQKRRIEHLIGPIENKGGGEVHELLDLQLIDKSKQLDLLRYHIKQVKLIRKLNQRRNQLSQLGKRYQILLSEQSKRETILKVDIPVKRTVCEIQNSIHAVEVQLREAEHIKNRYQSIKNSLADDAAKFESKIRKIEGDLQAQRNEIENLQKILQMAVTMKNNARRILVLEEREAVNSAKEREKQLDEGRRLVSARKSELESLEKKIYQGGKLTARPEPEGAEEIANQIDDKSESTLCQIDVLENSFEKLKAATGAPTAEKTLEKFSTQRDTLNRLETLRAKAEAEKEKLEKKIERKAAELEFQKYSQVKDAEKTSGEMERKNKLLQELQEKAKLCRESINQSKPVMQSSLAELQKLYIYMNPTGIIQKEPLVILENIKRESKKLIDSTKRHAEHLSTKEDEAVQDEKWLPAPYIKLISKTPISQQGTPAPPPGSDEEEEVPSRGHLKRQAQIVVDAKYRRKNIKMQLPKRI